MKGTGAMAVSLTSAAAPRADLIPPSLESPALSQGKMETWSAQRATRDFHGDERVEFQHRLGS